LAYDGVDEADVRILGEGKPSMAQLTRMCSLTSKSRRTTGNLGLSFP